MFALLGDFCPVQTIPTYYQLLFLELNFFNSYLRFFRHLSFWLKVTDGGALLVVRLERMTLQRKHQRLKTELKVYENWLFYLRKRAEWSGHPSDQKHQLRPILVGDVREWEHDGRQPIKRDDNHDKPRKVDADDPEENHNSAHDIPSKPGNSGTPGNLHWNLDENHLQDV